MKKIKIAQIGVGHDHAAGAFSTLCKCNDVFDVVGYAAVPEDEGGSPEVVAYANSEKNTYAGHPRFTVEELLAIPDLDAVAVECYDPTLTKYSLMAAKRGLHVYMDKPGGEEDEEFEELMRLMKAKELVFEAGYMYRYNPAVKQVIADVKAGKYGTVYSVEAQMNCEHALAKRAWMKGYQGGMTYFLGCHLLDLILTVMGPPEEVIPFTVSSGIDGVEGKDLGMTVLRYPGGVSFAKACDVEPGGFMRRQLVVCGSKGTVELRPLEEYGEGGTLFTRVREVMAGNGWTADSPTERSTSIDRYEDMIRDFADMILTGRKNPYTYEYELLLHRVVLAACGIPTDYKKEIVL